MSEEILRSGGRGGTVIRPFLDHSLIAAFEELKQTLTKGEFNSLIRDATRVGGRILLAKAKELVPSENSSRLRKNRPVKQSRGVSHGTLRESLSLIYRPRRDGGYVVVGANRETTRMVKRGKKQIMAQPSKSIHLVEKGFTAVARQKGIQGSQRDATRLFAAHRLLKRLREDQDFKLSRSQTRLLARYQEIAESKLRVDQSLVSRAQARYKDFSAARRTEVPGHHFLARAQAATATQAITAMSQAMETGLPKLIQQRLERHATRGRYRGPQRRGKR